MAGAGTDGPCMVANALWVTRGARPPSVPPAPTSSLPCGLLRSSCSLRFVRDVPGRGIAEARSRLSDGGPADAAATLQLLVKEGDAGRLAARGDGVRDRAAE